YRAYQPAHLEDRHEMDDGNESMAFEEKVGRPDADMEAIIENAPLQTALASLDERKQRIIQMRFYEGRSQQEVADELGLSQMHISRLERSALQQLRGVMAMV
ncbi:MAG TPA: sigma-70 family RNA polymerase sigma factor, partial [Armatimonadota bacterium]|nr:sigma-70 family RNA polymerase sigma factor [Armatimonadota bacterium]